MELPELPTNSTLAHLRWVSENELSIDWRDGHASVFLLAYLRKSCPCALCKEDAHGLGLKRGIRLQPRPPLVNEVKAVAIEPVGRYAIQIVWNDGHRTGIYSYDYLRKLCPCKDCKPTADKAKS
ncbi:DUF971 domain-containing protein [Candidatus Acetothermia bacterium]|nr:DUF971 domain-containing protein [Candidatus Acetothermia bacterium]MBI3461194.1 DUF971 domain-containing protein [Candidatus Acetothermia bacterium]MBI3660613.1 DUF971 domain-containing protein [Candidatus Acetothermia bacterium]